MRYSNGKRLLLAWGLVLTSSMILTARAQEGLVDVGTDPDPALASASTDWDDWPSRSSVGVQQRADTDVGDGSSFSVSGLKLTTGSEHKFSDVVGADVQAAYARLAYDFSDTEALGGKPWEDITLPNARALARVRIDDQWVAIGGPVLAYSAESGAGRNAMTGGAGLGAIYTVNPDLKAGLLVAVRSEIQDSVSVVPIPVVRWRFADQWSLRTGASDVAASTGLGAEVGYAALPDLSFELGAQVQRRRFRLDDAGTASDGVGEDKSTLLYAQSTWQPIEDLTVQVVAGVGGGTLTLEDQNGDELSSEDFDPGLMVGARATLHY